MARCWDWCTRDHEHDFGPGAGNFGTRRITMTADERREVELKTGVPVYDRHDMDAALAEKGIRHAEKGEACHERFDALREAGEGGKLDERHSLKNLDLYGDYARHRRRKPFDAKERYHHHRKRLGL